MDVETEVMLISAKVENEVEAEIGKKYQWQIWRSGKPLGFGKRFSQNVKL